MTHSGVMIREIALLFGLSAALSAPYLQSAVQREAGTISGTVRRADTLAPLSGATVSVTTQGVSGTITAFTDDRGHFVAVIPSPGEVTLRVAKEGFFGSAEAREPPVSDAFSYSFTFKGGARSGLDFLLSPGAIIYGQVLFPSGIPAADVPVQLSPTVSGSSATTLTNYRGEYRFFWIPPGRYRVSAVAPPFTDNTYVSTYFPGTTDKADSTVIDVQAGEEIGRISFALLPQSRPATVTGQVVGPRSDVSLFLLSDRGDPHEPLLRSAVPGNRVDSETGRFELEGVAPGTYTLAAVFTDEGGRYRFGTAPVSVGGGDSYEVAIVSERGVDVVADVLFGAAGTTPRIQLIPIDIGPRLLPLLERISPAFGGSGVAADDSGSVMLPNIPPGHYFVAVASDRYYVADVRRAGRTTFPEPLAIDATLQGTLQIVIERAAALDVYTITAGTPVVDYELALLPIGGRRGDPSLFRSTSDFTGGAFAFRGLAPGEYLLFALPSEMDRQQLRDPEFVRLHEDMAQRVSLTEPTRYEGVLLIGNSQGLGLPRPISVVESGTIEGTLTDPTGNPVQGAMMVLFPPPGSRDNLTLYRSARTAATGQFMLSGVVYGAYTLMVFEELAPAAAYDLRMLPVSETVGRSVVMSAETGLIDIVGEAAQRIDEHAVRPVGSQGP